MESLLLLLLYVIYKDSQEIFQDHHYTLSLTCVDHGYTLSLTCVDHDYTLSLTCVDHDYTLSLTCFL